MKQSFPECVKKSINLRVSVITTKASNNLNGKRMN